VFAAARKTKDRFPHPAPQPLLERPDLAGLPIRMGVDCHLGKEAAENLNLLSQKLRDHLSNERKQNQPDTRINVSSLRAALEKDNKARKGEWEQPEAIPTLIQMLRRRWRWRSERFSICRPKFAKRPSVNSRSDPPRTTAIN
jgi:hypothetical protein